MLSSHEPPIRFIEPGDLSATLEIYRPYVENTTISFEYQTPSFTEWQSRVETIRKSHPWLVYSDKNETVGYAYACKHRDRAAYSWSVDSAVYVSAKYHRNGIGRKLYQALFEILRLQGYVNVHAGVTMPNDKSEQFHLSTGFREIGTYKKVGYKFGRWHDTKWFQLTIGDHTKPPEKILSIAEIQDNPAIRTIFARE